MMRASAKRPVTPPGWFGDIGNRQFQTGFHQPPDDEEGLARPDTGAIEPGLEQTEQFGLMFQGGGFAGAELELDASHLPHSIRR